MEFAADTDIFFRRRKKANSEMPIEIKILVK
jgi:hypothetical protein